MTPGGDHYFLLISPLHSGENEIMVDPPLLQKEISLLSDVPKHDTGRPHFWD
jgi:hypothetical protein